MRESTMVAYAEVDSILELIDESYLKEIPEKIRNLFKENKLKEHKVSISTEIPLDEQNLSKETLEILASLNYNYWCKDDEEKKRLLREYNNNEIKVQEELRKKYNPDIFAERREKFEREQNVNNEETKEIKKYEESVFRKIINKIKSFFRR